MRQFWGRKRDLAMHAFTLINVFPTKLSSGIILKILHVFWKNYGTMYIIKQHFSKLKNKKVACVVGKNLGVCLCILLVARHDSQIAQLISFW